MTRRESYDSPSKALDFVLGDRFTLHFESHSSIRKLDEETFCRLLERAGVRPGVSIAEAEKALSELWGDRVRIRLSRSRRRSNGS